MLCTKRNQIKPSDNLKENVKMSGSKNDNNQNKDAETVTIVVTEENPDRPPDIFKLNIDCYKEISNYLAIEDLISLGKTCKFIKQMITFSYYSHYKGLSAQCSSNAIYASEYITSGRLIATRFIDIIHSVYIKGRHNLQFLIKIPVTLSCAQTFKTIRSPIDTVECGKHKGNVDQIGIAQFALV